MFQGHCFPLFHIHGYGNASRVDVMFSPEDRQALLVTLEDLADDFGIIFIEAPAETHRDMASYLQNLQKDRWIAPLIPVGVHANHYVMAQVRMALGNEGRVGVVLYGLDPLAKDPTLNLLGSLNLSRDVLPSIVRGPMIILGDRNTLKVISEKLPDFYSWRVLELTAQT